MPNLALLKLAAIGLLFAGAFAFGWYQGSLSVEAEWSKEKAEMNARAAEEIADANDQVRAIEQQAGRNLSAITVSYETQLRKITDEKNTTLRDTRNSGLFINAKCPSDKDTMPSSSATASGSDAETRVRLPDALAESLISLASEADAVTEQLTACQALVNADRAGLGN
jgi:hypothetical protein